MDLDPTDKMLLKALYALNHLPNRRLSRDRNDTNNTYSLATEIEDHLAAKDIRPYAPAVRDAVAA